MEVVHKSVRSPKRTAAIRYLKRCLLDPSDAEVIVNLIIEAVHDERGRNLDMVDPDAHDRIMRDLRDV